MAVELKTKKRTDFRNYEIVENGLKIEEKLFGSYNQQTIPFWKIEFEEVVTSEKPSIIIIALLSSVILNFVFLILYISEAIKMPELSSVSGIIAVVVGLIGAKYFKFEREKHLYGHAIISFWYFKKEQKEVDDFIEKLKAAKKQHYRKEFFKIEEDGSTIEETKRHLSWLKSVKYISEKEYQEKLSEIEKRRVIKGF